MSKSAELSKFYELLPVCSNDTAEIRSTHRMLSADSGSDSMSPLTCRRCAHVDGKSDEGPGEFKFRNR